MFSKSALDYINTAKEYKDGFVAQKRLALKKRKYVILRL